ncbi:MAG: mechanosensitive ion channel domain-containing protein [Nannocystaceae bacterium]
MIEFETSAVVVVGIVALAIAVNFVAKRILLRWVKSFIVKTETKWDDILLEKRVFDRLSHIAPAIVIYTFAAIAFPDSQALISATQHVAIAYMTIVVTIVADGTLSAVLVIYRTFEASKARPIKSYLQVIKVFIYILSAILVVSTLTDRSPWAFLSGLGALTAIIMLVFKDTILGFVASIQLTANDMVQVGDWVEMPKFGADGEVLDVSLNTVKVQNWDKTISTVPTYAMVSETFKNWRGMTQSGGRRIKRALYIDMNSVKFVGDALLERLRRIDLIEHHVVEKEREIREYNATRDIDTRSVANGRKLTNLGVFRAYVVAYLKNHPNVHHEMTFLVRHLPPGPEGLGIEIYVFSNDQAWSSYESIQADIFDHLLAVLSEFELRIFQNPASADFRALAERSNPSKRPH